jgi:hypothetical protein
MTITYQDSNINQLQSRIQELKTTTEELQQEIDDLPIPPAPPAPRTIAPLDVTLNSADKSAGTSDEYARGDHVHYVDLSNLKAPVKIMFLNSSSVFKVINSGSFSGTLPVFIFYFKFPKVNMNVCTMNINIFCYDASTTPPIFNSSQIPIRLYSENNIYGIVDATLNYANLDFTGLKIVYYTEASTGEVCYYLKFIFNNATGYVNRIFIRYENCSSINGFPSNFNYNNMFSQTLPTEMEFSNFTFKVYPPAE